MPGLAIKLGCLDYDHTRALREAKVSVEGIDLTYISVSRPSQIFLRMLRDEEFDASEMSLSNYLISLAHGDRRFVAVPVFPSRLFRHSSIWINANADIREPRDLIEKRVGIPDYSMTALLFIRGMLKHQYGVKPEDMRWFRSRSEHVTVEVPPNIRIENIGRDQALDAMLEEGQLDAIVSTSVPESFRRGSTRIRRLFSDSREVEAQYYRKTGIFPIMHTLVIRRAVYQENPWVATHLATAFQLAKEEAYGRYAESLYPMPWFGLDLEFATQALGEDVYRYGVEGNLPTLEAATLFAHELGLTNRRLNVNELFAPETLDLFTQ